MCKADFLQLFENSPPQKKQALISLACGDVRLLIVGQTPKCKQKLRAYIKILEALKYTVTKSVWQLT